MLEATGRHCGHVGVTKTPVVRLSNQIFLQFPLRFYFCGGKEFY